ncbi:sterol 24-C-methyltransferase [Beauveria bassiana ARSEF 2860]|uniref:Sterol 24-C-methyltransferase n=1 Tax=Beauveria bassiana (strain ARSEF 2860) TaxID=655819 RepID=J5JCA6_BEAB2|nr:sterol 24-C-methyltransferase [Beauveria bassiana ARSEF 2860]EJP61526.1 sterol 24-C-methyltransferase [Beauveria bassiana ARSEF 2860]
MTYDGRYDSENLEHRELRLDIEQGDVIAQLFTISDGKKAMKTADFQLQVSLDLAEAVDRPHHPGTGRLTRRIAPPGTKKTADGLGKAAGRLVQNGKAKLSTPMYLMVSRKPVASENGQTLDVIQVMQPAGAPLQWGK